MKFRWGTSFSQEVKNMIKKHSSPVLVALVALLVALVAGCGSEDSSPPPKRPSTSTSTYASPTKTGTALPSRICTDASSCSGLSISSAAPQGSGITGSNYTYTVKQYLEWVISDADTEWSTWFRSTGLSEPDIGYRLVFKGEQPYTSTCSSGGKQAVAPHDYANAFYCGNDSMIAGGKTYKGMIVLPITTFQRMWLGDIFGEPSTAKGDFAAAGIVAHEFGHHITDELALQLRMSDSQRPQGKKKELLADCFAGNWTASVFVRGNLDDGDFGELVAALNTMGDPNVTTNDHGTASERIAALKTGSSSGKPVDCLRAYWPAALN